MTAEHEDARIDSGGLKEPGERAAILLVDDRPANLLSISAILEPLGHEVVTACSGDEALRETLVREFAVILLDVQMPGMDGLQTAEAIKQRERSRHTPIIFLTALNRDTPQILSGYERGAVDYLLKPFEPEILRMKVAVFVELHLRGERIKRQERQLRKQERDALERQNDVRFRSLTDAMPQCVWAAHADGRIRYVNASYERFAGAISDGNTDFAGVPALHSDDRQRVSDAWNAARDSEGVFELECRLRRARDGAFCWHLLRGACERDEGGAIVGWIATAVDIDDRKRAEVAISDLLRREQRARADAEKANRAKDEFVATVSHELRTPLSSILGWTQMLRNGSLDQGAAAKALETIERNARAQIQLTEDILDISRVTMGTLKLDSRVFELGPVIDAAVQSLEPAAAAKEIDISVTSNCPGARVLGDVGRIQQVVWNLLGNAVKFTRRHGHVRVRIESGLEDAEVHVSVSDNGIGIRPEFLPHVFERFQQADTTNTRVHGGLGLGLAIVRQIVELHGGTVCAESDGEGRGATFSFALPRRSADASISEVPRLKREGGKRTNTERPRSERGNRNVG